MALDDGRPEFGECLAETATTGSESHCERVARRRWFFRAGCLQRHLSLFPLPAMALRGADCQLPIQAGEQDTQGFSGKASLLHEFSQCRGRRFEKRRFRCCFELRISGGHENSMKTREMPVDSALPNPELQCKLGDCRQRVLPQRGLQRSLDHPVRNICLSSISASDCRRTTLDDPRSCCVVLLKEVASVLPVQIAGNQLFCQEAEQGNSEPVANPG